MCDGEAFHISLCNTSVLVEFLRTAFFSFKLKNEGKTQQAGGKKASCKTTGRFQRRELGGMPPIIRDPGSGWSLLFPALHLPSKNDREYLIESQITYV